MNLTVRLTVVALVLTSAACAMRAQIYTPGAEVTAPVLVTEPRPYYTEEAMLAKIQGAVRLACVVLPDGTVDNVQVVRWLDTVHGLDTPRRWRPSSNGRLSPGPKMASPCRCGCMPS